VLQWKICCALLKPVVNPEHTSSPVWPAPEARSHETGDNKCVAMEFAVLCWGLQSALNTPPVLSDLHQGQEVMKQTAESAAEVGLLSNLLHLLRFVVVCDQPWQNFSPVWPIRELEGCHLIIWSSSAWPISHLQTAKYMPAEHGSKQALEQSQPQEFRQPIGHSVPSDGFVVDPHTSSQACLTCTMGNKSYSTRCEEWYLNWLHCRSHFYEYVLHLLCFFVVFWQFSTPPDLHQRQATEILRQQLPAGHLTTAAAGTKPHSWLSTQCYWHPAVWQCLVTVLLSLHNALVAIAQLSCNPHDF